MGTWCLTALRFGWDMALAGNATFVVESGGCWATKKNAWKLEMLHVVFVSKVFCICLLYISSLDLFASYMFVILVAGGFNPSEKY